MSKLIKVLSIDGGGIRGVIPAMVLAAVEKAAGKPTCRLFDLISGTSTGGILALGLTRPSPANPKEPQYRAEDLIKIYADDGEPSFPGTSGKRFIPSGISPRRNIPAPGWKRCCRNFSGRPCCPRPSLTW